MKQLLCAFCALCCIGIVSAQQLPAGWEELTAPDFIKAVDQSEGVCIIPMGVIEKHGPHLPLGTDVFRAHELCHRAAGKEYCIVFPDFYVGQIYEAQHQPGTVSYSVELVYKMLDETCKEISRNGIKKILLVNTHGGNTTFLQYFCQTQLESPKDYAVYLFQSQEDAETREKIRKLRKTTTGGHADEVESGEMMVIRPELVKSAQATAEPGRDMNRQELNNLYTGIWWYAKYPNHYAGDGKDATAELGEIRLEFVSSQLAEAVKQVKKDNTTISLQNEFYKEREEPLETVVKP